MQKELQFKFNDLKTTLDTFYDNDSITKQAYKDLLVKVDNIEEYIKESRKVR